jgi:hypothetical protein
MRINKNYWLAASGTLAVAGAMMLFSAHRIEAQFSQPVRVLNTSAGPVLNSRIDDPGRIPYISFVDITCPGAFCTFTFPAIPAGHRLVIQHVSGALSFNAPTGGTIFPFVSSANNASIQFSAPTAGNVAAFDQPVLYYVDAGQSAKVSISAPFNPSASQFLSMVGYELDCNAGPCVAIAN